MAVIIGVLFMIQTANLTYSQHKINGNSTLVITNWYQNRVLASGANSNSRQSNNENDSLVRLYEQVLEPKYVLL